MEEDSPVIYGLEFPCRTLAAQKGETEAIRFFVGTQCLRENQIHLVEYDDDTNVVNKTVFPHDAGEIWGLAPSTGRCDLLATVCDVVVDSRIQSRAALWRVPDDDQPTIAPGSDADVDARLIKLAEFEETAAAETATGGSITAIWHPGGEDRLATLVDDRILVRDVAVTTQGGGGVVSSSSSLLNPENGKGFKSRFSSGKWNPHHNSTLIATANETHLRGWDLRSMKSAWVIENAHSQLIRDFDFNPNKQYVIASCGDDCKVKFWDVRKAESPMLTIAEHSHWVWAVKYNNFHDQLLLTSSSDSRVMLHNASSVSSEPAGQGDGEADSDGDLDDSFEASHKSSDPLEDGVLSTYEEHEDSVYAVDWSSADPWVFASLSYDGRLVINRVPRNFKYRILL